MQLADVSSIKELEEFLGDPQNVSLAAEINHLIQAEEVYYAKLRNNLQVNLASREKSFVNRVKASLEYLIKLKIGTSEIGFENTKKEKPPVIDKSYERPLYIGDSPLVKVNRPSIPDDLQVRFVESAPKNLAKKSVTKDTKVAQEPEVVTTLRTALVKYVHESKETKQVMTLKQLALRMHITRSTLVNRLKKYGPEIGDELITQFLHGLKTKRDAL